MRTPFGGRSGPPIRRSRCMSYLACVQKFGVSSRPNSAWRSTAIPKSSLPGPNSAKKLQFAEPRDGLRALLLVTPTRVAFAGGFTRAALVNPVSPYARPSGLVSRQSTVPAAPSGGQPQARCRPGLAGESGVGRTRRPNGAVVQASTQLVVVAEDEHVFVLTRSDGRFG
jgi:hypothetical protein